MKARTARLLALLLAGCGGARRAPVITDYDLTCAQDSDCVAVFAGNPGCCSDLACANGAVRSTEVARVASDDSAARTCPMAHSCPFIPCEPDPAICVAGQCRLWQHPETISPDAYDRSCETVADCAAVFIGPPSCCSAGCPNAAIRTRAVPLLTSDLQNAAGCGTIAPPCATMPNTGCPDGRITCNAGTCQFEAAPRDGGAAAPHDAGVAE